MRQSYLLSRLFLHILCILFRQIFSEGASEEYLHEIANWPMPVGGWPANCKELTLLRRVPKARRGSIVLCLCVFFASKRELANFKSRRASQPGSSSSFERILRSQDFLPVYGTRGNYWQYFANWKIFVSTYIIFRRYIPILLLVFIKLKSVLIFLIFRSDVMIQTLIFFGIILYCVQDM